MSWDANGSPLPPKKEEEKMEQREILPNGALPQNDPLDVAILRANVTGLAERLLKVEERLKTQDAAILEQGSLILEQGQAFSQCRAIVAELQGMLKRELARTERMEKNLFSVNAAVEKLCDQAEAEPKAAPPASIPIPITQTQRSLIRFLAHVEKVGPATWSELVKPIDGETFTSMGNRVKMAKRLEYIKLDSQRNYHLTALGRSALAAARPQGSESPEAPQPTPVPAAPKSQPAKRSAPGRPFTVREVADRLNCSPTCVYDLIRAGKLEAFRLGSDWRILADSFRKYTTPGQQ